MFKDILFYFVILVFFFFSIFCLIRYFIVILNINFNKIYLTKKFSIIKLVDENEIDVSAIIELITKLNAIEKEYDSKLESYNKNLQDLNDINITYTTLLNANTVLKNEIDELTKKLETAQGIVDSNDAIIKAEASLLLYQSLLFENYMFINLSEKIYENEYMSSVKDYQNLLMNSYISHLLLDDINKTNDYEQHVKNYQQLLYKTYVERLLMREIKLHMIIQT